MHSADGRFVIIYNGEVYSHAAIRIEIEATGHCFKGHSDTEVIVEQIARSGVRAIVDRLIGMFAIAVWDKKRSHAHVWFAIGLGSSRSIGANSAGFSSSAPN